MCVGEGGKIGLWDGLRVGVVRWPISCLLYVFLNLGWRVLRTMQVLLNEPLTSDFLVFGFFVTGKSGI